MADVSASLASTLTDAPHLFLQPSIPLYTDALAYLKHALDPIAAHVSSVQQQRRQEVRKKRKRGSRIPEEEVLRLKQIHTQGFTVEQVWEQSRRVIDAVVAEAERGLQDIKDSGSYDIVEDALDEEDDESSLGEEGVDYQVEGPAVEGEDWSDDEDISDEDMNDLANGNEDYEDIGMDDYASDLEDKVLGNSEPPDEFVSDKFGLNDGFFSIDDFNRNSEFLEQQDVRGEDDGAASDEEDLDWDADPLSQIAAGAGNGPESGEEDEEDGPTFGDPDAPSEDDEDDVLGGEMDGLGDMANTNSIMYADFFAPPAQRKKKNKKGRPNPHNFPEKGAKSTAEDNKAEEEDMERTMAAVHRDLFDDDESESDEGDDRKQITDDPRSRRSTHEKRKAALADEIRKLEAANVAKRSWTLSGEARAADRPVNSLLEEDLEFERSGKPVPVITAEVSESLEELIKRRILAHDFQDIPRRRPDDLATGNDSRRGKQDFILDDSRSKKGLAEEYEEEHLRRSDPNFIDVIDTKLKKEHSEIETLWKKISSDLDGLSSWNFRPKQPAPQLDIRVDAPAITMEDARPSVGGEIAGASQLAPQEVYRVGEAGKTGREEDVGKSGLAVSREESTRDEKKRRRRREKERLKKADTNGTSGPASSTHGHSKSVERRQQQRAVLGNLKKGGVGVIGKKGQVTDVEGREAKSLTTSTAAAGGQTGGVGRFKL